MVNQNLCPNLLITEGKPNTEFKFSALTCSVKLDSMLEPHVDARHISEPLPKRNCRRNRLSSLLPVLFLKLWLTVTPKTGLDYGCINSLIIFLRVHFKVYVRGLKIMDSHVETLTVGRSRWWGLHKFGVPIKMISLSSFSVLAPNLES